MEVMNLSMPDITLERIDRRIALASVIASIALQEAAVSHVLNAEGEKIQAVVGMPGVSATDLRNINRSVEETVNNFAMYGDDLRNKLKTVINALYPKVLLIIHFVDIDTGEPVNCECIECELTNNATGETSTFYARRDTLTIPNLKPGSYTLNMIDACLGYALNADEISIYVDSRGNVTFNGAAVTDDSPAKIELSK